MHTLREIFETFYATAGQYNNQRAVHPNDLGNTILSVSPRIPCLLCLNPRRSGTAKSPASVTDTGLFWCRQPESNRHGYAPGDFKFYLSSFIVLYTIPLQLICAYLIYFQHFFKNFFLRVIANLLANCWQP